MPSRKGPRHGHAEPTNPKSTIPGERELIVVAHPDAKLRATPSGIAAAPGFEVDSLSRVLASKGATVRPLFEGADRRPRPATLAPVMGDARPRDETALPDLTGYFRVDAADEDLDSLAESLRALPSVQAAYVKPETLPARVIDRPFADSQDPGVANPEAGSQAVLEPPPSDLNEMTPSINEAPPISPDFTARQLYRTAAPVGVDAVFAATIPGGRGTGVRIIDVEGEWRFTHEDLVQNQGGVAAGTPPSDIGWRNHGTAVMGEIGGDVNGLGITGIAPDAFFRGISIFGGLGSAPAIRRAADLLSPGDIILIELHRPGPRATGVGQQGYIAIEWWPDDYDAIRYATGRGVIVIEAAGNGAQNLDDPIYDTPAPGFPATWRNPFRRSPNDSGAILVGAGAPPPGTHGHDWGPDRSRLDFSNYGAAVDAQGWGREVTTTGYGDLQGGTNEDLFYTDQFSGTSSASPIVVGAVASVQGVHRARAVALLTPASARSLLRTTGSPQQDAPGRPATQRIGNRPNIRQMVGGIIPVALTVPLFRYWNPGNTDHFYTTNFNELGAGKYGWGYEGIQCYVIPQATPGAIPLYRYWNAQIADHFYTTNFGELGSGRYGWAYEGVQCYVYPQPGIGRVALYRYWNGQTGDHFYTTNFNELGPGKFGYHLEGVQCFVATGVRPPEEESETMTTPESFRTEVQSSVGTAESLIVAGADSFNPTPVPAISTPVVPSVAPMAMERSISELEAVGGRPINFHFHLGSK
jgi:hypothetical protein